MERKNKLVLLTILIASTVFVAGLIIAINMKQRDAARVGDGRGRPCTMEAKLCPDGSSVGRTGPNCEFEPCPEENNSKIYSVDELVGSGLPERTLVNVSGILEYRKIDAGPDYEGPGGGHYLRGKNESLFIEGADILKIKEYPLDTRLTFSGKVKYCGGGKITRYICGITDARLNNDLVGNDRDEYGCIGSAGYSWCEEKQKCLRSWEEKCGNIIWRSVPQGDEVYDSRDPSQVCKDVQDKRGLASKCKLIISKRSEDKNECIDGISVVGCFACGFICTE